MLRKRFCLTLWLVFALAPASIFADEAPPSWLQEASKRQTPAFEISEVPGVVLHNEENIVVYPDGRVVRTFRMAVRVLTREGRDEAIARAIYQTDSEKVLEIKAWLIRPQGTAKAYGKKEVIDAALMGYNFYDEARIKILNGSNEAVVGDVFGYETVTEERRIFSQSQFEIQGRMPVMLARCTMTLPDGWRATSKTFNYQNIEPSIAGNSYTWELRDLKPINYEPGMPNLTSVAPRLAINFYPAQGSTTSVQTFASWNDVGRWMASIEDPQMRINDAIAAKAQELTANSKTEFEKIQAISRYVQGIQYVSIQIGTGRGGGYIPRLSTEVFAKSYGDCKDKANLMRALLSAVKIESYMVSIFAGDPDYVQEEWASPHQFNHCIIAIKINDQTDAPTVVSHPKLGRLLIFDSTDQYTLIGDLPHHEQGSLALIDHKDSHSLVRMPVLPPELNRLERTANVTLDKNGNIAGTISQLAVGQTATRFRKDLKTNSPDEYSKIIESWLTRGLSIAKATSITPKDDVESGKFTLDVTFNALSYAQIMQGRLMVFKPAIIGRFDNLILSGDQRIHPFILDSRSYSESIKIKLPDGFVVDEMPEPTKLDSFIGKYSATYEVKDGHLIFSRSMTLNKTTIPAEKYESLRQFFGRVRAAEGAPVVLMKQ